MQQLIVLELLLWQGISCQTASLPVPWRVTNIPIRHCKCLLIKVPYPACYVPLPTILIVVELLFGRRSPAIPKSLPVLRRVTNIPIRHHKYLLIKVPYSACYVPPLTTLIVVELLFGRRSPAIPTSLPVLWRVTNIPI